MYSTSTGSGINSSPGKYLVTWFAHVLRTPRAMSMGSRVSWYKLGTDGHDLRHVRASGRKIGCTVEVTCQSTDLGTRARRPGSTI